MQSYANNATVRVVQIRDVRFGDNVEVVTPVNLYECDIGEECFIGPFVEIQRGVTIGKYCRIQSHVFICELVEIGDHCFVSHGAMFINDTFASGSPTTAKNQWSKTCIGNYVSIGTNATILPVKIIDHVIIGAGAVVTKNIDRAGVYAGNPARFLREIHPE